MGIEEQIRIYLLIALSIGVVILVIYELRKILLAFIDFKKPEYFCSNCQKKLRKKVPQCPKCKSVFESDDE